MSTDIVVSLKNSISKLENDFNSIAGKDKEKFKRESIYAFQQLAKGIDSSNDKTSKGAKYKMSLAQRNPIALKFAVLGVASLDLTLDPIRKEAYLVPRDGQISLDVGYMGLLKLAKSEGIIEWCQQTIVRENDLFEWINGWTQPIHKETNPFSEKLRGKPIGVYCAYSNGRQILFQKMSIEEVYEIRDRSDSYKNTKARPYSPWVKSEGEMIKKTMVRRASKEWQSSGESRFYKARALMNEVDGIDFEKEREEVERGYISSDEKINQVRDLIKKVERTEEQFLNFFKTMSREDITLENMGELESDKAIIELQKILDNALTRQRERENIEPPENDNSHADDIIDGIIEDSFTANDIEF